MEMQDDDFEDEFEDEFFSEDDDEIDFDTRTVLLAKNEMFAILGLRTNAKSGFIVRVDPRESAPALQRYEDPQEALRWFKRSLNTSQKNGWRVLYDGEPLEG